MKTTLDGLNVVVTGAGSGIGFATAALLNRSGARVVVADLHSENITAALESLAAEGGETHGCVCDVRSEEDCERLFGETVERFGSADALVHCAGILRLAGSRPRPLHEMDIEEYDAVIGTNLRGTFLVNRAALRAMMPGKSGQIVNISSTSGLRGRPLDSLYSASKAGVVALSDSIAEEVRAFGVRVQVILPDAVDTPLWQQNGPFPHAPPGSLPPERVAEVIAQCLSLPKDTVCDRLVVRPFESRKRRRIARPDPHKS